MTVNTEDSGYLRKGEERRYGSFTFRDKRLYATCPRDGVGCTWFPGENRELSSGLVSEDFNTITLHMKGMRFHGKLAAQSISSPESSYEMTVVLTRAP